MESTDEIATVCRQMSRGDQQPFCMCSIVSANRRELVGGRLGGAEGSDWRPIGAGLARGRARERNRAVPLPSRSSLPVPSGSPPAWRRARSVVASRIWGVPCSRVSCAGQLRSLSPSLLGRWPACSCSRAIVVDPETKVLARNSTSANGCSISSGSLRWPSASVWGSGVRPRPLATTGADPFRPPASAP
jgi:hypothetical protein